MSINTLYIACAISGADYDLAQQANRRDRELIVTEAIALLLVGVFVTLAWSVTLAIFVHPAIAVACAAVVGGSIFMLDRAIVMSDWRLAGVLATTRSPAEKRKAFGQLLARIGVAVVLALGTSFGLTLKMFEGRIVSGLQQQRTEANAPLMELLAQRSGQVERQLLGTLDADIDALRAQFQAAFQRQQDADAQRNEVLQSVREARLNADRERVGDMRGSPRGEGPRYREFRRLEAAATEMATEASRTVEAAIAQQEALKIEIGAKQQALVVAREQLTGELKMLREEIERDPRWVPERSDVLSRYSMLHRLKDDPLDGMATVLLSLGCMALLMTLELVVLIMKVFFTPASVYKLRLVLETRLEAARAKLQYDHDLAALRGGPQRAVLRLVGREDAQHVS